jgi:hypothetical protein
MYFIHNIKYKYENEGNSSLSYYSNNNTKKIIENIQDSIMAVVSDFMEYPDKYLTESDVRCFLFNKLMDNDLLNCPMPTSDRSKSIPVHTEVRWYGNEGKLKYRSDMVIIETPDLITKGNKVFMLPSKGFGFNKFNAIIEIKLRRTNGESDRNFIEKIKYDVEKLIRIENDVVKAGTQYASFVFILDKKNENNNMHNLIENEFFTHQKYHPEMDLFICYASPLILSRSVSADNKF